MIDNFIIPFLIGIFSSIIAAAIYTLIRNLMNRSPKLYITGNWLEYAYKSTDRQFTFGSIKYDRLRNIYIFNGTNYYNNGIAFCHFNTIASYIDIPNKRFFYIFESRLAGDSSVVYFGFGVVNLGEDSKGRYVPVDGHYVSADVDGIAIDHTMQKTNYVYSRNNNIENILGEILKDY